MDTIEKIYKEIGESDYNQDVSDWLNSGYLPLNKAMGGRYDKGFPVGRIIEIYGGPSAGKTLLATSACIETQKRGGLAIFLDHEHAFSISRAIDLGLQNDRNNWIYKQPNTAEESFKIIEFVSKTIRAEHPDKMVTIVIDSVASMVTQAEFDTEYGDENMKTRLSLPVLMSTSLKKLAPILSKTNTTLIFLNQTRDNPGVMFGEKTSTPGGNSLKFYASLRIKVSKGAKVKEGDDVVGENVTATIVKNKVYVPYKTANYITSMTHGINVDRSHIEALKELGRLGDTKGYLEFNGKKYRLKELEQLMGSDSSIKSEILALFEDSSTDKLDNQNALANLAQAIGG